MRNNSRISVGRLGLQVAIKGIQIGTLLASLQVGAVPIAAQPLGPASSFLVTANINVLLLSLSGASLPPNPGPSFTPVVELSFPPVLSPGTQYCIDPAGSFVVDSNDMEVGT